VINIELFQIQQYFFEKGFNPAYAKQPKENSENANNKSKKSV